jgi:hypothetical protein
VFGSSREEFQLFAFPSQVLLTTASHENEEASIGMRMVQQGHSLESAESTENSTEHVCRNEDFVFINTTKTRKYLD